MRNLISNNILSLVFTLFNTCLTLIISYLIWKMQRVDMYRQMVVKAQIQAYKALGELLVDLELLIDGTSSNEIIKSGGMEKISHFLKKHQMFISVDVQRKAIHLLTWFFHQDINYKLGNFKSEISDVIKNVVKNEIKRICEGKKLVLTDTEN